MSTIHSAIPTGVARRHAAVLSVLALMAFSVQIMLAGPAAAAPYNGGFSPTIVGGRADLNGNAVVTGRDDSNQFYGETHIIDGRLDCNTWLAIENAGTPGDGAINASDDCTLVGFDGTSDGVTIQVADGVFQVADGRLPTVFNAADPDNPDISASDFAWSTIGGRVDANGDEFITADDCHFGLIGRTVDAGLGNPTNGADTLGNDGTNPCGFAPPPADADDGLVDLNSDVVINAQDSCNRCFFGHGLASGVVQERECPGRGADPRNQVVGTSGADVLTGTAGADVICGLRGNDTLIGLSGNDLLLGGAGADRLRGGGGADTSLGGRGPDRQFGGRGRDRLVGGIGPDRVFGGRGRDRLVGGLGPDRLFGGPANDRLFGGSGRDRLFGGAHNDRLDGGPGFDLGVGGPGADTFFRIESQQP